MHKTGRPVLVGTTTVEKSERLSALLEEAGIKHQVCTCQQLGMGCVCMHMRLHQCKRAVA